MKETWTSIELPTGVLSVKGRPDSERPLAELCDFAARNNPKRGFLFVSKVLGKHIPSNLAQVDNAHRRLAEQVRAEDGPVVFVGMAETAVGLGYGVFEKWLEANPGREALFLQSTRYPVDRQPCFAFEESHSHAPDQVIHYPQDAVGKAWLDQAKTLVLVDDEVSTGNTFVNLWNAFADKMPRVQSVNVVTLTDFMGDVGARRLREAIAQPVTRISLTYADWRFEWDPAFKAQLPAAQRPVSDCSPGPNSAAFGRLGITAPITLSDRTYEEAVDGLPAHARVLVLGTGEFMAPAQVLMRELALEGYAAYVQSTTRSPILPGSAITRVLACEDHQGQGVPHYLYNVNPEDYDRILILHETPRNAALLNLAAALGGAKLVYAEAA